MVRKVTLLVIYIVTFPSLSFNQEWIRVYESLEHAQGRKCSEHYDKGFLVSGFVHIDEPVYTAYGWILKTDVNGYEHWRKTIKDSTGLVGFAGHRNTSDGGFITIGSTSLLDPTEDPLIMKFNACGEKEWCRIFNSPGNFDYGSDIETIPGGGYLGLVKYWGYDKSKRIWLFKLDESGDLIWQQAYALDSLFVSEEATSLYKANDTSFIITGYTYWPDTIPPNYYFLTPLLIKVNIDGNSEWELPWGWQKEFIGTGWGSTCSLSGKVYTGAYHSLHSPPYGDAPCLLRTSSDGNPIDYINLKDTSFLGQATTIDWLEDSTLIFGATWQDQAPGSQPVIGANKTDTAGNVLNTKVLMDVSSELIIDACVTDDNKAFMFTDYFNVNLWKWQVYAFKLTSNLEYDSIYTTPFTYDSLCPHPIVSDTIPLDDCEVVYVGIDDPVKHPEKTMLKVYPNPAGNMVTVEMPEYLVRTADGGRQTAVDSPRSAVRSPQSEDGRSQTPGIGLKATTYYHQWKSVRLDVFDLFGKLMYSQDIPGKTDNIQLDISSWSAGMYVARIVFMNDVVGVVKFVKE